MKVSLFEMLQKKRKKLFHDIIIFWDAPVYIYISGVATGGPGWAIFICGPPNEKLVIFQMDVIY